MNFRKKKIQIIYIIIIIKMCFQKYFIHLQTYYLLTVFLLYFLFFYLFYCIYCMLLKSIQIEKYEYKHVHHGWILI
jgi:hypothetical protein